MKVILKKSIPLLIFGFLLTFFSSYGQTFLLSLYVPEIIEYFDINNTLIGTIYAIATISSGLTLPWLGGLFDRIEIRKYTLMVIAGLTISLTLLSLSEFLILVLISFYGLRLFGQGLMSHISVSSMAKYFDAGRGKAIGFATLGHPAGEAALPIIITTLIGVIGWRASLQLSALSCVLFVSPFALYLLYNSKIRIRNFRIRNSDKSKATRKIPVFRFIRQKHFFVIAPMVFMLGFTNTALFFFQLKLGEARDWTPELVAGSLSAFAISSAVGTALAGPFVDKYTGKKLYKYFIAPYLVGLLILIIAKSPISYPVALLFLGIANGAGNTIKNSMLAEVYGTDIIGSVRSIFTTVMVISTGLGPVTFGLLLDSGFDFSFAFSAVLIVMTLAGLNIIFGLRKGFLDKIKY